MIIAAVLKSGGDFDARHGEFLEFQVAKFYPDCEFRLYSDLPGVGTHKLVRGLPRWWSKYEAYSDPTLVGPLLMLDLDVVILQRWDPPNPDLTILCTDTNRVVLGGRKAFIGAFCYLQDHDRALLCHDFFANPIAAMATSNSDDQPRLARLLPHAVPVQNFEPDAVVLYKVHVQPLGLQPGNKFVLFHGQPRPWESGESWVPALPVSQRLPAIN